MFEHFLSRSERHLEHRRSHGEWMWRLRKPQRYVGGFVPPPPRPPSKRICDPKEEGKEEGGSHLSHTPCHPPTSGRRRISLLIVSACSHSSCLPVISESPTHLHLSSPSGAYAQLEPKRARSARGSSIYIYIYIYIYTHTHTYIYIYTCVYIH